MCLISLFRQLGLTQVTLGWSLVFYQVDSTCLNQIAVRGLPWRLSFCLILFLIIILLIYIITIVFIFLLFLSLRSNLYINIIVDYFIIHTIRISCYLVLPMIVLLLIILLILFLLILFISLRSNVLCLVLSYAIHSLRCAPLGGFF